MSNRPRISRRDFLKATGVYLGAFSLAPILPISANTQSIAFNKDWPSLRLDDLPASLADILARIPTAEMDTKGYFGLYDPDERTFEPVPLVQTQFNLDHSHRLDRLNRQFSWGIVLHWFGDKPGRYSGIKNYLNGFNSLRKSEYEDDEYSTSAHFLVGDGLPSPQVIEGSIGIVQTQAPDLDGTPFAAAHIRGLSFEKYEKNQQYFYNAFQNLSFHDPSAHSLLQEMYAGRWLLPNARTIGIEITGLDFDKYPPSAQKIANTLMVIKAVMKRYRIPASNLLGHYEIQMNKGDPGKQFMALIRYLLGVKALIDDDPYFRHLVFGQHLEIGEANEVAVRKYFTLGREYHSLVSKPIQVFTWDIRSQYWNILRLLPGGDRLISQARNFFPPIAGEIDINGYNFLDPENHEGIDLHHSLTQRRRMAAQTTSVQLLADGQCLFVGEVNGFHYDRQAIFRHVQPDGGEVLSLYAHLHDLGDLKQGSFYPERYPVGTVANFNTGYGTYLHFAMAYGATWENELNLTSRVPEGAGPTYIRERFLDPLAYLDQKTGGLPAIHIREILD